MSELAASKSTASVSAALDDVSEVVEVKPARAPAPDPPDLKALKAQFPGMDGLVLLSVLQAAGSVDAASEQLRDLQEAAYVGM